MAVKYYAVKVGRRPGIYMSWDACKKEVDGFSGAAYKSFASRSEAEAFLKETEELPPANDEESLMEAYVDGSYCLATGEYSYGMVVLFEGEELCFSGKPDEPELASMRNVAGEIKGAEAAMRYALERGAEHLVIYHDYAGIAKWCTGEWKTNRDGTKAYKAYFDSIRDALKVEFVKVKGHSHVHYNDMADKLAKKALGIE